jgi:hypothetical protein
MRGHPSTLTRAPINESAAALFGMIPGYALQDTLIGNPAKETCLAGFRALSGRP